MPKMNFILADTTALAMEEGLRCVAQKAKEDKFGTYIVLVPDGKTIMAEHRLLELSDSGAFANIYIYSMRRLLNKLSSISAGSVLTKVGGTMIVKKIVLDIADKLVCFKRAAYTNGFAEVMFGTISQLKSSGVGADELFEMIQHMPPSSRLKMQDVALIYSEYQQYILNKYYDESDLLNVLAQTVEGNDFITGSHVFFLGYESVTNGQLGVCKNLIANAKSFLVSASYGLGAANSHIRDNEVYNKFKAIADKENFYYTPQRIKSTLSPDFEHIKNNLYAYPAKIKQGTNAVELLQADSLAAEIDFVCEKIAKLAGSGVRYKQIAIVAPSEYHKDLSDKLTCFNITNFVAEPYSFAGHALFRLIFSMLEVVRKNYDAAAVIELASNILLGCGDISDFINYINKYGINHTKFCKKFEKYDENIINKQTFAQIEAIRQQICDILQPLYFADGTCGGYTAAIKQILEKLNITDKLQNLVQAQAADVVQANITSQALNKLNTVLTQIETFLATEKLGIDGLQSIIMGGLDVSDISLVPISQDCLTIASNIDGLFDIDYLFIMGAKEGSFPVKVNDCGIILDKDIASLGEGSQTTIEPTIRTINRRERYKAYEALLLANKKVTLSYSCGSGEESNKIGSIATNLVNIFGGEINLALQSYAGNFVFDVASLDESISRQLCTKANQLEYLCRQLGYHKVYNSYQNPNLVNAIWHNNKENLPTTIANKISGINAQPSYNIDNAGELYFYGGKTSTSQLERYFNCPFLFFCDYGLRLKENETSKLRAVDVGTILHAVAEQFVTKFAKDNSLNVAKLATQLIEDIFATSVATQDNKYVVKILKEESIRLCTSLADEILHSHFKPIGLEQGFGKGMDYPAVTIYNKGKQVALEGKIDRIDACGDKFRIIDYKTGKIDDNIKLIYYGKKIQLVTYLMAMQSSGLEPAAVVYYPIRNEFSSSDTAAQRMQGLFLDDANCIMAMDTTMGEQSLDSKSMSVKLNKPKNGEFSLRKSVSVLSGAQFKNLADYVHSLCANAIDEILQGYIAPSPIKVTSSEKLKCAYCPYYAVCGVKKSNYAQGRKCYSEAKIDSIDAWAEAKGKEGDNE